VSLTVPLLLVGLAFVVVGVILLAFGKGPLLMLQLALGALWLDLGMLAGQLIPPGGVSNLTQVIFAGAMLFWWFEAAKTWRRTRQDVMRPRG
jgi:hypothetical protein